MRRDALLDDDDNIQILLDTYNDQRNAFYFRINPLGTKRDAQVTDEGKNVNDDWNCVWDVEAPRTSAGWEAEIAIPYIREDEGRRAFCFLLNFQLGRDTYAN